MKTLFRITHQEQKGSVELTALIAITALTTMLIYFGGTNLLKSAISNDIQIDLKTTSDRIKLALYSEEECTAAFTSAPLNALNYTAGSAGTHGMDITNQLAHRGVTLAQVGQPLSSSAKIDAIWLENYIDLGPIRPSGTTTAVLYNQYRAQFKIQGSNGSGNLVTTESFPINLVVDSTNKVRYCYLNESAKMSACAESGGYLDLSLAPPKCRFNFTGRSCADADTCVREINPNGNLICSKHIITPTGPTPQCYCGCSQQSSMIPGFCGNYVVTTDAGSYSINANPVPPGPIPANYCVNVAGMPLDNSCYDPSTGTKLPGKTVVVDYSACILTTTTPSGCP